MVPGLEDVIGKLSELDSRKESRAEGVLGRLGLSLCLASMFYLECHL